MVAVNAPDAIATRCNPSVAVSVMHVASQICPGDDTNATRIGGDLFIRFHLHTDSVVSYKLRRGVTPLVPVQLSLKNCMPACADRERIVKARCPSLALYLY